MMKIAFMANFTRTVICVALVSGLLLFPGASQAVTLSFTGSGTNTYSGNSNPLSAGVVFDYNGAGLLTVTLQNTVAGGAYVPSDVLTSVLWTDSSGVSITPSSAALGAGSTLTNAPGSYDLGKEGEYSGSISGPSGTNSGISTSGLGLFGSGNFSPGGNPTDGMNYGIISGVNGAANPAVNGGIFALDTMVFTLSVGAGFNLSSISNVFFQYGTALDEPRLTGVPGGGGGVPEPGLVALLISMGGGGTFVGLKRRLSLRKL